MIEGAITVILCCYGLILHKIVPMAGKVKTKGIALDICHKHAGLSIALFSTLS